MRIFVTGASGYIGRAAVAELVRRGHDVAGLARSDEAAATVQRLGARPILGSLASVSVLARTVREFDATIHAGGIAGADDVAREAVALETMLAAAPAGHVFVYTSGAWVYGNRGDAVVNEAAPLAPLGIVAWRPAHEQTVLAAAARGVRAVVVRPGVVYGDGGGMVGDLVRQALPGPIRIVGDGTNRWPLVRNDALAELYAAVVEQPAAHGIYNAQTGASVPYVELARAASRSGGGDGSIEHLTLENARAMMGPFANALAIDLQTSTEKAKHELGWSPHRPTALEELANTVVP